MTKIAIYLRSISTSTNICSSCNYPNKLYDSDFPINYFEFLINQKIFVFGKSKIISIK